MELRVDPDTEVMSLLAADLACAAEPADIARIIGVADAELLYGCNASPSIKNS